MTGGVSPSETPVHKEVIVTATSEKSREEGTPNAIDRTESTVEHIQGAVVQNQSIRVAEAEDPEFEAKVEIGFEVE